MQNSAVSERHVTGLDAIRFVCASVVALSHGAAFPFKDIPGIHQSPFLPLLGCYDVAFNGPAAVVVFFIISGFCIHYPTTQGRRPSPMAFWARRGVRIAGPLAVAYAITSLLGSAYKFALNAVAWSVWCEIIYYALYPLIEIVIRKIGVLWLTASSTALTCVLLAIFRHVPAPSAFGLGLVWVVCLPSWLFGCILAEHVSKRQWAPRLSLLWSMRIGLWLYSCIALGLVDHGHMGLGMPVLLFPLSLVAPFWLAAEIHHFRDRPPPVWLERLGALTYSLYLVHDVVIAGASGLVRANLLAWIELILLIAVATFSFHLLVERPFHQLARTIGRRLDSVRPSETIAQA